MLKQDSVSQQDTDEKTSDLAAKQATVAAAQANVKRLEALESFKRITAPFDGIVTARKTDIGALIDAGGGDGPELFTGVRRTSVARLCERAAKRRGGDQAGHDRDTDRARTSRHEVRRQTRGHRRFDHASSGTLLVQLQVDNQNGLLIPGEYTEVHFAMPTNPHALLIPASSLIFRQQRPAGGGGRQGQSRGTQTRYDRHRPRHAGRNRFGARRQRPRDRQPARLDRHRRRGAARGWQCCEPATRQPPRSLRDATRGMVMVKLRFKRSLCIALAVDRAV